MRRPTFFVKRGDRLIARLKHMFHAWRFADQVHGRVVMMWPPNPAFWHQFDGADYSPSHIFDLRTFYAEGGGDDLVFLEGKLAFPAQRRSLRDDEFAAMRSHKFERDYFIRHAPTFHEQHAMTFSFKDEPRSREYTNRSIRKLYDRLPHDPVFARSLKTAQDKLGTEDYVGLHVRRGDVAEMLRLDLPKLADDALPPERLALLIGHYVCRTALDEFYYPEIEAAIRAGRKVVYFSDSPGTLTDFANAFGRRYFVDAETFRARHPIQKAFLDFNLLIGAGTIVSTGSNYASFAATLGKAELINVAAAGSIDQLEEHLYTTYLGGAILRPETRRTLRRELERQYSRRSRLRPMEPDVDPVIDHAAGAISRPAAGASR
jgi:hypothetical protein